MKTFILKVNGQYYMGEREVPEDRSKQSKATPGWLIIRKESSEICFTKKRAEAKIIEGSINLNSLWQRIYNAMRFDGLKVKKVEMIAIETVE